MSGATFDWTFPKAFSIRDAPPVESTDISVRGEVTTEVKRQ